MNDNAAHRAEVERFFTEDALEGEPVVVRSPSGRYELTIRTYRTRPDAWDYSRGTVVRVVDGVIVCDIKRNYGIFHHSFIAKDGREFLIAGRSYMSQTIVDLDRGIEYEPPGDHYDAGAFCWTKCYASPDGMTLAVDGCVWACPYEIRFFDFTDPANGWPELPMVSSTIIGNPSDEQPPVWIDARTIEIAHGEGQLTRFERRDDQMIVIG